jgi:hypothetical protein
MTICDLNDSLGAYLIAALDDEETDAMRAHLVGCGFCTHEAEELAGTLTHLSRLTLADLEQALGVDTAPARETRPRERRVRTYAKTLTAAAVVAVAVAVGTLAGHDSHGPAGAATLRASDTSTGAVATLRVVPAGTGSRLRLSLHGVHPRGTCYLVVHRRDGRTEVAATWHATHWGKADVHTTTSIPPSELADFDVVTASGRRLVQIPMLAQTS